MAKSRCRNLVVRSSDGRIVVATSKALALTRLSKLSPALATLLHARQQAGKDLTKALKDEGFDVIAGEETDVSDAGGDDDGDGKKKGK